MKDKILVIILVISFIAILFGINKLLKKQENRMESNTIPKETIDQNIKEDNMSVFNVNDNNFEEEVLKSEKPVLVDFYADWCGPCKMLSPIVDQVAEENDTIKVCRINVDENEEMAVEYGILSIPTLVVIKNGEETGRTVGVVDKSEILEIIK